MAPIRGSSGSRTESASTVVDNDGSSQPDNHDTDQLVSSEPDNAFLARRSNQPQFTLRSLVLGLIIGVMIAFSNTYFGLQTGWISGMAMPSVLIGFVYFKGLYTLASRLGQPFKSWGLGKDFSEVENVLLQSVAGSVGTMPLGCGFVGVIPALEYLLEPSETPNSTTTDQEMISVLAAGREGGGLKLPLTKLILWALGICFFGVLFAVPLRKEVIIREKLKFPTGTATALMISVLHGGDKKEEHEHRDDHDDDEESAALLDGIRQEGVDQDNDDKQLEGDKGKQDWAKQITLLFTAFLCSGTYTIFSYFVPQVHSIPFLGRQLADAWLWSLNPSPAYVGQGIIMGPATTIHMLLGAILGWAILSPIAKHNGWAAGEVDDWEKGSKGWIVWVSLAIMLADAVVSLLWLMLRPLVWYAREHGSAILSEIRQKGLQTQWSDFTNAKMRGYSPVQLGGAQEDTTRSNDHTKSCASLDHDAPDAPPEHLIGLKTTAIGMILSLIFCIFAVQSAFPGIISIGLTIFALTMAVLLSIMGVRALGETDLNPVSGISKLTQLVFAIVTPPGSKNAVVINLLAGAISESGALQAGDLLQDLKTGHLLGASPKAQFWGQLIGSTLGAVVSACVYKLYTHVYKIPSGMFQVPTGYVWMFTARLVTGAGLPPKIPEFAAVAAAIWSVLTIVRIYGNTVGAKWVSFVPGGIAVAVGMYNTPSFTLARAVGGLLSWWWTGWKGRSQTPVIVLASGLILGEGLLSIVTLALASLGVPHL